MCLCQHKQWRLMLSHFDLKLQICGKIFPEIKVIKCDVQIRHCMYLQHSLQLGLGGINQAIEKFQANFSLLLLHFDMRVIKKKLIDEVKWPKRQKLKNEVESQTRDLCWCSTISQYLSFISWGPFGDSSVRIDMRTRHNSRQRFASAINPYHHATLCPDIAILQHN